MAVLTLKRSLGFAALGSSLVLAVVLSACGGDDDPSTQPSIIIQPSTFSTIVSTTAPAAQAPAGGAAAAGATVAGTQVYEVQSGDFLAAIADDYGIPPESIANFNQWEDGVGHMLHPDMVINIPPGAQVPDPDDEEDEEDAEDTTDSEDEEEEPAETQDPDNPRCADGSRQGTYTIEEGDIPALVAEGLDVTVAQLNEANASTRGYSAFIVGADILVPCGDEDEDE